MNRKIFITLCLFLSFTSLTFSQSKAYFQSTFNKAKSDYRNLNYQQAFDGFKRLTVDHKNNKYKFYAYYYCGLSAFKMERYQDARFVLVKLLKEKPDWKNKEEVKYLMSNIAFKEGDYLKALSYKSQLSNDSLLNQIERVESNYVYDLSTPELKKLHLLYPDDSLIGRSLFYHLIGREGIQDQFYSHYLLQEFNITDSMLVEPDFEIVARRDTYNIVLFLPYTHKGDDRIGSNYLQFTEGVRMAIDSLKRRGIKLNLTTYNTKGDSLTTARIINGLDDKPIDFFLADASDDIMKMIDRYAERRHVFGVNAYGRVGKTDSVYTNTFFYKPSSVVLAEQLANYSLLLDGRDVVVIYSESDVDTVFANAYKKLVEEKAGKTPLTFLKVNDENITEITNKVEEARSYGDLSHIVVATEDNLIGSYVLTALERENLKVPVFVPDSWLSIQTNTFEQYMRRNIHFYRHQSLNLDSYAVQAFRKNFKKKMNIKPVSSNAHVGFDLMMIFGNLLDQHGILLDKAIKKPSKGYTLSTVDFSKSLSNQALFIEKFDDNYKFVCQNCRF